MANKKNIKKASPVSLKTKVSNKVVALKDNALMVSNEVAQDVYEKGKAVSSMALDITQKNVENLDIEGGMKKLRTTAGKLNDFALSTANSLVETGFENTKKWQDIGEKAVKGSFEIADKQQDIIFDNLYVLKSQFSSSVSRLKVMFK